MKYKNKIAALAPMAGYTDSVFRKLCYDFGADYAVSEMVSAKAMCYKDKKTAFLTHIDEGEGKVAIQIFGSEPSYMARAAKMLATGDYDGGRFGRIPSAIDINMGCPMPKIVNNGEGSALMKNPALAGKIVEAVVSAVNIPVTVKIRTGWDSEHKNAVEVAKILESAGASAICVHGRTREQMYAPFAEYETIAEVKAAVKIPVYGNGDVFCAADAIKLLDTTGCDGVMVARGAVGNPWIFDEIKCAFEGKEFTPPTEKDKLKCAYHQLTEIVKIKGEAAGIRDSRKQLTQYIKGMSGAAAAREKFNQAKTLDEITEIINTFLNE